MRILPLPRQFFARSLIGTTYRGYKPIIRQIMASDGVEVEDIRRLMQSDAKSLPSREGTAGLSHHIDQLNAA